MSAVLRGIRDRFFYEMHMRAVRRDWRARHARVYELNPGYRAPCAPEVELEHVRMWERPGERVKLDTLRICAALSGVADPRIVPEEVFAGPVEHCLAAPPWHVFFSHKSYSERLLEEGRFPRSYLHNINGLYYDGGFRPISARAAEDLVERLPYPVVVKPNTGAAGGREVRFVNNAAELRAAARGASNYLVQEVVRQHAALSRFSARGLNTFRVYTYRSVANDEVAVLNAGLRMGRGGSLDNLTAGGIACYVSSAGRLHGYAITKYGEKFETHPDTGIRFAECEPIPRFAALLSLAVRLAERIPMPRLAGWDFALDEGGEWRTIEVNLRGHSIRFAQYAGVPFFGRFTEEVIEHCARHPRAGRAELAIY
jgi:hypothetical protein